MNRKKVAARITLKNIVHNVLHKMSVGTPRNHENDGFANTKPFLKKIHMYMHNNRKLPPMGALGSLGHNFGCLGGSLGYARIWMDAATLPGPPLGTTNEGVEG